METINLHNVKNRYEFREWLIDNHSVENECWVVVKRGRPTDNSTFWYLDAVEEALCFGWIDSTTKKLSDILLLRSVLQIEERRAIGQN